MKKITLSLITFVTFSTPSLAELPRLSEFLETRVTDINRTVQLAEEAVEGAESNGEDIFWFFRRFTFRLRPSVTLTAGIAKIGIIPDIELLWERALPAGYVPYRP